MGIRLKLHEAEGQSDMNTRKLAGLALGLALPLTMVVSAAASDNDDYNNVRSNLGIGSYDDYKDRTHAGDYDYWEGTIRVPITTTHDQDDDGDIDYDDWGDQWSGYNDAVADAQSAIYDEVRDSIVGADE